MSEYDLYVINLDRSTQRLRDFQESFKNYNVKRISAFDGIKLDSYDNIKLPSIVKMPIPIYNYSNYKYYYACSLSHIQAIYEAYKLNKDSIIIDGYEGRKSLELINAIYLSIDKKKPICVEKASELSKLGF